MIAIIGIFAAMLVVYELAAWLERREQRRREALRAMESRPRSTRAGRVP
jgi:hypothetical protein